MSSSALVVAVATGVAVLLVVPGGDRPSRRLLSRRLDGLVSPDGRWRSRRAVLPPSPLAAVADATRRVGHEARRVLGRPADPGADLRVGAAIAAASVTAVVLGPWVGVVVAVVVGVALTGRERRAPVRRDQEVRAVLPDVVDLFRLTAGAGLSVHQSVAVVAAAAPEPVGPALREVGRLVGLGVRLGDALAALEVLGDPVRPLVSALTGAARYGAPLSVALDRVAVDSRLLRRRRAEERARRLPVQLLFPLVMCVLPAFVVLAVVPLLAGSLPSVLSAP